MSFWDSLRGTSKKENDYRRDLDSIVRSLPEVKDTLNMYGINIKEFRIEGDGRKFTCQYGRSSSLTIYVEDSQYRLVFEKALDNPWRQEQVYDRASGIEILRIMEDQERKYTCKRDKTYIEKVYVVERFRSKRKIPEGKVEEVINIADPLEGTNNGGEFDIATLSACGNFILLGKGNYLDFGRFIGRDDKAVTKAVRKSRYSDQCCKYDKTVEEMLERI